ncbi:hypothetical protein G7085_13870 [Tessaracoccus sp. HDW20]|uniref:hypothetical protein n=1 Tax=Tessaracoccus coleopterorum TaxID=2714950 RepID=UPI0018D48AD5|nr:hypothetical protein [Tessaracoccus coleopterorum]NHB85336.1 hypothetical protein [Tessaracoccus coleopterorum]
MLTRADSATDVIALLPSPDVVSYTLITPRGETITPPRRAPPTSPAPTSPTTG